MRGMSSSGRTPRVTPVAWLGDLGDGDGDAVEAGGPGPDPTTAGNTAASKRSLSVDGLLDAAHAAGPGLVGLELLLETRQRRCSAAQLMRAGGMLARVGNWITGIEADITAQTVEQLQVEEITDGHDAERLVVEEYALRTTRTAPACRDLLKVGMLAGQRVEMATALKHGDLDAGQAAVIVRAVEQVAVPAEWIRDQQGCGGRGGRGDH